MSADRGIEGWENGLHKKDVRVDIRNMPCIKRYQTDKGVKDERSKTIRM